MRFCGEISPPVLKNHDIESFLGIFSKLGDNSKKLETPPSAILSSFQKSAMQSVT